MSMPAEMPPEVTTAPVSTRVAGSLADPCGDRGLFEFTGMHAADDDQHIDRRMLAEPVVRVDDETAARADRRVALGDEKYAKQVFRIRQPARGGKDFEGSREIEDLGPVINIDSDVHVHAP